MSSLSPKSKQGSVCLLCSWLSAVLLTYCRPISVSGKLYVPVTDCDFQRGWRSGLQIGVGWSFVLQRHTNHTHRYQFHFLRLPMRTCNRFESVCFLFFVWHAVSFVGFHQMPPEKSKRQDANSRAAAACSRRNDPLHLEDRVPKLLDSQFNLLTLISPDAKYYHSSRRAVQL